MKITAIEHQKKTKERVNIFIDGEYSFGLPEKLLVDLNLYRGKEVSEKELQKYKKEDSLAKCLDKAYRFLSYRMRSEKEVRDKLLEKYDAKTVQEAIKKLREYKYISDSEFARSWVQNRITGRSKRALKVELLKKGIKKEVIDEALSDINSDAEYENALALVRSLRKYQNLTREEAYKKVGGFLSRRGYSYEIIKKVINEEKN